MEKVRNKWIEVFWGALNTVFIWNFPGRGRGRSCIHAQLSLSIQWMQMHVIAGVKVVFLTTQQARFTFNHRCHEKGLNEGKKEETLTLLTSLNYLHIPICHPDHSQGTWRTGLGKDGREKTLLGPGTRREKVQWHAGRKSASDQQGLANQSFRRAASCSFWLEWKELWSRWCSPVPAVLQRRGKKEVKKKKKRTIKETHPCLMQSC